MKKITLIYALTMIILLTSCGNKNLDSNLTSNETLETTSEYVTNNEDITTTSQPKVIKKITSDNTEIQLGVNETVQLTYELSPKNADKQYCGIDWVSTDNSIASIDENGNLTGVDNGMCTIIATSKNNPDVLLKYSVTVSGGSNVVQVIQGTTIYISTTEFTTTTKITTTTTPPPTDTSSDTQPTEPPIDIDTQPSDIDISSTENTQITPTYINDILIVNSNYPLPNDFSPPSDAISGDYNLITEVQQAFDTMNIDAISNGINLNIHSGYISYDEQSVLYQNALNNFGEDYANHYVDQAGYSENQSGLTILLNSANETFDNTPEASWIAENCYKYGFIIRYPQGKENITGKNYRSYQIRYVGIDIATEMYNQNICLEEYLQV